MFDFVVFDLDNLFLGQWSGKFVEVGDVVGIVFNIWGCGVGLVDFNVDGLLDLVVVNWFVLVSLFCNMGKGSVEELKFLGNWFVVDVCQLG